MAQLRFVGVVIILLLPIIIATSEKFYLKSQTSSLEYESFNNWKTSGSIKILIQFETQTAGRIFTLLFKNEAGQTDSDVVYFVSVASGSLIFGISSAISTMNIDATDGKDHYVLLTYTGNNKMSITSGSSGATVPTFLNLNTDQQYDLNFVFGQYLADQSIIGCVDINMNIDKKRDFKVVKDTQIDGKCPTPCSSGQLKCKNGKCTDVTLSTSACDCYGTNFGGDLCDKAFNSQLQPGQEMGRQDVFQTEVLLQPTEQDTDKWMYGYYQEQYFHLETTDGVVNEKFSLDPNNALWHSFTLKVDFDNRMLDILFDKEERKVQFGTKWLDWPFAMSHDGTWADFNWGTGPTVGVDNAFKGCLKNVFVDAFNVIEMTKSGNQRVRSKDVDFGSCPIEKIEVTTTTASTTPSSANSLIPVSMSLFMIMIFMLFSLK